MISRSVIRIDGNGTPSVCCCCLLFIALTVAWFSAERAGLTVVGVTEGGVTPTPPPGGPL